MSKFFCTSSKSHNDIIIPISNIKEITIYEDLFQLRVKALGDIGYIVTYNDQDVLLEDIKKLVSLYDKLILIDKYIINCDNIKMMRYSTASIDVHYTDDSHNSLRCRTYDEFTKVSDKIASY